jgi:ribosome-binding protein aMBF1 (putative translation factor)
MITNERQYRISKAQADAFRRAIAKDEPLANGKVTRAQVDAMRARLDDLEAEIAAYDRLQSPRGKSSLVEPLEGFGSLIVQARTARGWTQAELAERVGVHMQQIAKYEKEFYAKTSLTRIGEICLALGLTGEIRAKLVTLTAFHELISKAPVKARQK